MIDEGFKSGKEVEFKNKQTLITQLQVSDENTKEFLHLKFGPGALALHSENTWLPYHHMPVCFSIEASSARNSRIKTVLPAGGSLTGLKQQQREKNQQVSLLQCKHTRLIQLIQL